MQTQIYGLINNDGTDSATRLTGYDSLKTKLVMLLQNDDAKDSLHNIIAGYWEEKDQDKDSMLQTQQLQYSIMNAAWNKSLQQEKALSTQNNRLQKQTRKQKTKSKLAAAGILIIAGFTAHYLLMH
ncbi:MAG: hypothetical protein ABUT20_40485 [Bacteroidota bacterium]